MRINPKKVVTIDFETYYSTEYSLSKPAYNTSSYIRSPQFKAHCCAIKIGSGKTRCYPTEKIAAALRAIDWDNHHLLAQNTAFDAFILAEHYKLVLPKGSMYLDTMSMARGLHGDISRVNLDTLAQFYGVGEKSKTYLTPSKGLKDLPADVYKELADGCILDTELTYAIFCKQIEIFPESELRIIDLILRMFVDSPLEIDEPLAREAYREELVERHAMIIRSGLSEKELMSNEKFAAKLREYGVEPPTKISHTTGELSYAFSKTDPEFLALTDSDNLKVVRAVEGRLAAKSTQVETRAQRLIEAGTTGARKLPVAYTYYAAKTGRLGGSNKLNLQNLPRGSNLRRSIVAPKDHVLVIGDSAQIEARTNAWLNKDEELLRVFSEGGDPYCHMATDIYGRTIDKKKDPDERFIGKVAVLGLGYGMGHRKFQTTLALGALGPPVSLSLAVCNRIVKIYRSKRHAIVRGWKEAESMLTRMAAGMSGEVFGGLIEYDPQTLWLPNGMPINYPQLHRNEEGDISYVANGKHLKLYGGLVIENIVQALARIVVFDQMLWFEDQLAEYELRKNEVAQIVMTTHDEIVACIPKRYEARTKKTLLSLMSTPPVWCEALPVSAEVISDICYSK